MKQGFFAIECNERLTETVYRMTLSGDCSALTRPGQFVNIELAGLYLRRPISVCNLEGNQLTLIYKIVGKGTEQLAKMGAGEKLDLLTGLGNGYDTAKSGDKPLLIGGGVGVPPLYLLAKTLVVEGKNPRAILGFNTASEVFLEQELRDLGIEVTVTTVDGSRGIRGFVTDAMKEIADYTYIYTCGPEPMLRAVALASKSSGQYSFEERMGCGFGACMGCTCETKLGHKRICVEGPVLEKEELTWLI